MRQPPLCHKTLRTAWIKSGDWITTGTPCVGPECMAWVWTDQTREEGFCGLINSYIGCRLTKWKPKETNRHDGHQQP